MSKRKKINKFKVSIVIIIVVLFLMTITGFGRFVYNTVKDRYLSSKSFYFTSNLLTTTESSIDPYTNWDGNGIYEIDIDLFSQDSALEQYNENLYYSVILGYNDSKILCALNPNDFKESTGGMTTDNYDDVGMIPVSTHKDTLKLYIKPVIDPSTGKEKILPVDSNYEITVRAYTTSPYRKTIGAKFKLNIADIAYEISENEFKPDVILNVCNNYDYDSDVTISFREDHVRLDLNDSVYVRNKNRAVTNEDGVVTSITFTMPAESSKDIRFYKDMKYDDRNITIFYNYFNVDRVKKE